MHSLDPADEYLPAAHVIHVVASASDQEPPGHNSHTPSATKYTHPASHMGTYVGSCTGVHVGIAIVTDGSSDGAFVGSSVGFVVSLHPVHKPLPTSSTHVHNR